MKSIDMRCRPPYGNFNNDWFFGNLKVNEESCGRTMAESAWKRDMSIFLREMDEAHVAKAVVAGRYAFPGVPVEQLSIGNNEVSDLVNTYPDRFIGVISADVTNHEQTFRELDTYVNHGVCTGLTLETLAGDRVIPFDDRSLYPLYEKCAGDNIFVLYCTGFVYPGLDAADPKAIDHVARDFPSLRIMISHGGWPYVTESCFLAFRHANVYLSPDSFMLNRPGAADYINAANYLLQDKMCFGTAYPFLSFKDALEHAQQTIREEVLEKYLYENAARFLGIE
jgi:hypothetical protein